MDREGNALSKFSSSCVIVEYRILWGVVVVW